MTNYRSLALVLVCGVCVLMELGAEASVLVPTSGNARLPCSSARRGTRRKRETHIQAGV